MPETFKGTIFLLALVTNASFMPVEQLPLASWQTAFGLGFLSSVFDNIPLTALALKQGGYDWGFLAYCVGFGGSMIWFGSSAGVAISNMYPEAKSVGRWLREGWFIAVAYVIRLLRDASHCRMASRRAAQEAHRFTITKCPNTDSGPWPIGPIELLVGALTLSCGCRSRIRHVFYASAVFLNRWVHLDVVVANLSHRWDAVVASILSPEMFRWRHGSHTIGNRSGDPLWNLLRPCVRQSNNHANGGRNCRTSRRLCRDRGVVSQKDLMMTGASTWESTLKAFSQCCCSWRGFWFWE